MKAASASAVKAQEAVKAQDNSQIQGLGCCVYAAPFIQIFSYHYEITFRTVSRETTEALRPGPSDKFRYLVAPVLYLVCTISANAYSARIKVYMYYYIQERAQAIRHLLAAQKLL